MAQLNDASKVSSCHLQDHPKQPAHHYPAKTWQRAFATIGLGLAILHAGAANAQFSGGTPHTLFISSAIEQLDGTVNLPVYVGTSGGQTVYYIITEASDQALATQLGVNYAPILANARNSAAVQYVSSNSGPYTFPATVTFNSGTRSITPANGSLSPTPTGVAPARGNTGYSPLIQLPNGIILNAPHVQNNTGHHPKLLSLNTSTNRIIFDETDGFQGGQPVRYISTDASTEFLAAAENAIYAPALQQLPGGAIADLALIDDGQRGYLNPESQGYDYALTNLSDPLNILQFNPTQAGYSPMWEIDVHQWTAARVSGGQNLRQRDYNVVENLEAAGQFAVIALAGAGEKVVNCPIIARRSDSVPSGFTPFASSIYGHTEHITTKGDYTYDSTNIGISITDGNTAIGASNVSVFFRSDTDSQEYSCVTDQYGRCSITVLTAFNEHDTIRAIGLDHSTTAPGIANASYITDVGPGSAIE